MMRIKVDEKSGFCFGVDLAVKKAEEEIRKTGKVYCLGEIVHNDMEVKRLEELGMITINYEQYRQLKNETVLIRAHGEPPETYRIAEENDIKLIDASCPIVLKFQNRIIKANNGINQVVIYGKKDHPEIIGLSGQIDYKAIIIEKEDDIELIDYNRPIALFSQTTKAEASYEKIAEALAGKIKEKGSNIELKVHHTICGQVSDRDKNFVTFSKSNDIIIFVGGKNSSNAKTLYNLCKSINDRSYFITATSDIKKEWFKPNDAVGICGATSTPKWLMEKAKEYIAGMFENK